jgi:hypothetical protein
MASKGGRNSPESDGETAGLPFLRFYHSKALRIKTLAVLDDIETSDDPTDHRDALADVVLELTEEGLGYYFVKPVKAAKVGFAAEKTTTFGIAGILRVMGPVARRVLGGMDANQLLVVSKHIRHMMK